MSCSSRRSPLDVVECESGSLDGTQDRGAHVFRNIPFAAPPVGELRFEPPQDPQPWTGVRDATRNGPIAPQGRSRLGDIMGDFTAEQSEDCLTLTVWTPAADAARRPVLVFIHGGGFSSGAGSLPWYSGHKLAVANNIVVVTVNYRLGALGYLYLPGVSPGTLGLMDNIAALRWVQRNIERFGGDPGHVTVAGQSAGAMSAFAMMASPAAQGLFHRAILQSAAFGSLTRSATDAASIGTQFAELLGVSPGDRTAFKALPVSALLEASGKIARLRAAYANISPPFLPTIVGATIPGDIIQAVREGAGAGIDLMIGTTREEAAAFTAIDPALQAASETQVHGVFERVFGNAAGEQLAAYRRRRPLHSAEALLADVITDEQLLMTALRVAEWRAAAGRPAYLYQFDLAITASWLRRVPLSWNCRSSSATLKIGPTHRCSREPTRPRSPHSET